MNVVVLEDAVADIEAGKRFYDSCKEGVGDYFENAILADVESLVLYAGVHSRKFGFHRALSKRFPVAIYYLVEGETAYVYAILDMRRDPAWIRQTLADRAPE